MKSSDEHIIKTLAENVKIQTWCMRWTNCCSYSKRISLWLCKKASLKVAAWSWGLCLLEEYHRRRHCQKHQLSAHFSWWHPLSCKPQGIQFPEGKRRLNPLEEGKHIWWTWTFGRKNQNDNKTTTSRLYPSKDSVWLPGVTHPAVL